MIASNINANADVGILTVLDRFRHQLGVALCVFCQRGAFSSSADCRLERRHNSAPISAYSSKRARHLAHSPMCFATSREIVSPSERADTDSAASPQFMHPPSYLAVDFSIVFARPRGLQTGAI